MLQVIIAKGGESVPKPAYSIPDVHSVTQDWSCGQISLPICEKWLISIIYFYLFIYAQIYMATHLTQGDSGLLKTCVL